MSKRAMQRRPSERTGPRTKRLKAVVIDASVALKWYLSEEDSGRALRWYRRLQQGRLLGVVPEYFFLEVSNVLLTQYRLPLNDLLEVMADLSRLGLEVVPFGHLRLEAVIEWAAERKFTTYDAAYLELGRVTGLKLLTADEELLKHCPRETVRI